MNNHTERLLQSDLQAIENDTAADDLFRLAQARKNVLAQNRPAKSRFFWPAMATSLASVMLVSVFFMPFDHSKPVTETVSGSFQSDITEDNLDLYEDLDFYTWLAQSET